MFTKTKLLRVALPFLLAASVLTSGTPSASAAVPVDGYYGCNSGEYVSSSSGSGRYRILSGAVFSGSTCSGIVFIPNGVTSLGDYAFDSSGLTSITIPNSVTSIGQLAFAFAQSLTSITIPNSVTSINFATFAYATSLTSITIPNSVTRIDEYAFYFAPALTSITIPSGVTSFGLYAFLGTAFTSYTYCGSASLSGTGISGTPTSCSSAPGAPTIGTATATGTTTATVTYTAPTSNGGSTILSYTATSNPGSLTATITQATSGTISVTGLSPSTSYTFTITALNSVGASSASSASNSITTSAALASGVAPLFTSASSYDGRFTLQIKDYDSAFTYTVTSPVGTVSISTTGLITVTGLRPDQSVTVTVTTTRTGYASGSGSVSGRSQVAPMLPGTKPIVTISDTLITCTIGSYSAAPTSATFSLFVDGKHVSTIFSALGEYLPDWIIPWATSSTITRTATLSTATWSLQDAYKGKAITCATLAYSKNAIGFTASQVMVAR